MARKSVVSLFLFVSIFIGLTFVKISQVHGYSFFKLNDGKDIRWADNTRFIFRVNEENSSGLSRNQVFNIFTTSLQRWQQISESVFTFTYYQGKATDRYPNRINAAQDNVIFFTSNADSSHNLGCSIVALTQLWFKTNSGELEHNDIRFNDNCFEFTDQPNSTGSMKKMYLADIALHELGHAIGLDHSANAHTTMTPVAYRDSYYPSCDDQAAILHLYKPSKKSRTGTLSGKVVSPDGNNIFGAQVSAIDTVGGRVLASVLSDKDGRFEFAHIAPGPYAIFIEPYPAGAASLSAYYSSILNGVCKTGTFQKSFVSENNLVRSFLVKNEQRTDTGTLTATCGNKAGGLVQNFDFSKGSYSLATQKTTTPVSIAAAFSPSVKEHYYLLTGQMGRLKATAMSYSLFSPANLEVDILDMTGNVISSNEEDIFYSPITGYTNFDTSAEAQQVSPFGVFVRVRMKAPLYTYQFPMNGRSISSEPIYLLNVGDYIPTEPSAFNPHPTCLLSDNFSKYQDQGEAPPIPGRSPSNSDDDDSGPFGCGTITDTNSTGGGGNFQLNLFLETLFLMAVLIRMRRFLIQKQPSLQVL